MMAIKTSDNPPARVPLRQWMLRPWQWRWRTWAAIVLLTGPAYFLSYAPMYMLALGVTGHSDGTILQTVVLIYRPTSWLQERSEVYSRIFHWEVRAVAPVYQWLLRRHLESHERRANRSP